MIPEAQAGEAYASAVGELWSGLAGTLTRLEALAFEPERLAVFEGVEELRRLQYALHAASEGAFGLSPPAAAGAAHDELTRALAAAREATGELVDALDREGVAALDTRLYTWRGALFLVRLARLRVDHPEQAAAVEETGAPSSRRAALALGLCLVGVTAFALGAGLGRWPLWVVGALVLACSPLAYRL